MKVRADALPEGLATGGAWRPWLVAALGVGCLALLIWGVVAQVSKASAERERAAYWELHTLQVQVQTQMLLVAVEAAESGQRGFLLSGDRRYLASYGAGVTSARQRFAELQRLTHDNPLQQQRLREVEGLLTERVARLEKVLALAHGAHRDAALRMLREEHNRQVMVDLRNQLDAVWQSESILRYARQEQSRKAVARERQSAALGIWLGLAMLLGVAATTATAISATARARRQATAAEIARQVQSLLQQRVDAALEAQRQSEAALRQAHKMEAIGQLAGGIAHDFNNMLTIILGSLEMAQRRSVAGKGDVSPLLENAADGARRAAALTQRILAFSRQQPLEPRTIDGNGLIDTMSELLRRTMGAEISLDLDLGADLWPVRVDANQLESVVLNLAVNARDAMPGGGVLTISTRNETLEAPLMLAGESVPAGDYVRIDVADTGLGMAPDVVARAFEPFFTTKGVGKGTGLGLSQALGFVKQSGGHIQILSEEGKGATVRILLPRARGADPAATPATQAAGLPDGGDETILVVEDDDKVRAVTVDALLDLGYEVRPARNGAEALDLLSLDRTIALLITDLNMPGMSGQELAAEAHARRPGLPILFTSAFGRGMILHEDVHDGVVSFLPKPFSLDQLAHAVRQKLDS